MCVLEQQTCASMHGQDTIALNFFPSHSLPANSFNLPWPPKQNHDPEAGPFPCFLSTAAAAAAAAEQEHPGSDGSVHCLVPVCGICKCNIHSYTKQQVSIDFCHGEQSQWIEDSPSLVLPPKIVDANFFPIE